MKNKKFAILFVVFLVVIAVLIMIFYIKTNKSDIEQYKNHKRSAMGTQLLYADDEKVIMYDMPGLFVYDLNKNALSQILDFSANGIDSLQGSEAYTILCSEDGNKVFIKRTNNTDNIIYDVENGELTSVDTTDLASYFGGYLDDYAQYDSIFEDNNTGYPESTPVIHNDKLYYLTNTNDTNLSGLKIICCENDNIKTFNVWE